MKLELTKDQIYSISRNMFIRRKDVSPTTQFYTIGLKNGYYLLNVPELISNINRVSYFIKLTTASRNSTYLLTKNLELMDIESLLQNSRLTVQTQWVNGSITNWKNNKFNLFKNSNNVISGKLATKNTPISIARILPSVVVLLGLLEYYACYRECNKLHIPIVASVSASMHQPIHSSIDYILPEFNNSIFFKQFYNLLISNALSSGFLNSLVEHTAEYHTYLDSRSRML